MVGSGEVVELDRDDYPAIEWDLGAKPARFDGEPDRDRAVRTHVIPKIAGSRRT